MKEITISFPQDDHEMIKAIEDYFGKDMLSYETKSFDGYSVLITVVVPIAALTIQAVDFFFTYFAKKKGSGRFIKTKEGSIILDGYTADEVKIILEALDD